MPYRLVRLLAAALFFFVGVFLGLQDASAVQVTNKSNQKIGAALIGVKGDHKKTLFVKILQPNGVLDFTPTTLDGGALLVSVKVFDTDQTLRVENAALDIRLSYEDGKLVPESPARK